MGEHPSLSLAKADFTLMIECTPEIGHCHSVCTLWVKPSVGLVLYLLRGRYFCIVFYKLYFHNGCQKFFWSARNFQRSFIFIKKKIFLHLHFIFLHCKFRRKCKNNFFQIFCKFCVKTFFELYFLLALHLSCSKPLLKLPVAVSELWYFTSATLKISYKFTVFVFFMIKQASNKIKILIFSLSFSCFK